MSLRHKDILKDFNNFLDNNNREPEYLVLGIRKPNGKVKIIKNKIYEVNNTYHFEVTDKESKIVSHPDTQILNYMLI